MAKLLEADQNHLPIEIWLRVLSFLPPKCLFRLHRVCRAWKSALHESKSFWRVQCRSIALLSEFPFDIQNLVDHQLLFRNFVRSQDTIVTGQARRASSSVSSNRSGSRMFLRSIQDHILCLHPRTASLDFLNEETEIILSKNLDLGFGLILDVSKGTQCGWLALAVANIPSIKLLHLQSQTALNISIPHPISKVDHSCQWIVGANDREVYVLSMKTRRLVQVLDIEGALQVKVVAQGIIILTRSQIKFWSNIKDEDRDFFKQASLVNLSSFNGVSWFPNLCVTDILPNRIYGLILSNSTQVISFIFDDKFQFQKGFDFHVVDTTIQCLQIHSLSRLLIIGTEDQELRYYDYYGNLQRKIILSSRPQSLICPKRKMNENRFIVSCYDGSLINFKFHENKRGHQSPKSKEIINNESNGSELVPQHQSVQYQESSQSSKTSGSLEVIDEGIRRAVMAFHLGVAF